MKLSDIQKAYDYFSGKASDIARQLSLAGLAIIWIFKKSDSVNPQIPANLILPFAIFVIAIAFDLLQYISGTIVWGGFHRFHERSWEKNNPGMDLPDDFPVTAPGQINWATDTFFILKLSSVSVGYGLLLIFFWKLWTL